MSVCVCGDEVVCVFVGVAMWVEYECICLFHFCCLLLLSAVDDVVVVVVVVVAVAVVRT